MLSTVSLTQSKSSMHRTHQLIAVVRYPAKPLLVRLGKSVKRGRSQLRVRVTG